MTSPPDRREAIAAIVGSEMMAEFDAAWTAFSRLGHLRVTVYGPYDAGKTTLIKRLLIEDGTPVPDWLAISGRPETMQAAEAESGGIGYVDTPGTATRSAEHDRLAEEALALTDAVLVVLPQQRLQEDTGWLAELAAAGLPPGALLVAIGQSDTVGADPQSDLEEFRRLAERRRAELLKVLPRDLTGTLAGAVSVVAADPYGEVGNTRQPDRGHYDSYRAWDGIAELRVRLSSLARRLPELRGAARDRFWERAAALARAEGERELDRLSAMLTEAGKRRDNQAMLERELTAIDDAAAGALRQAIGEELNAVPLTAAGMDVESIRSATEERLQRRVRAWQVKYGDELQALAQRADVELAAESVDPGSVQYDQWLRELVMPQRQEPADGSIAERAGAFSDPAAKAVEGAIRLHLRVPIDEARNQLKVVSNIKEAARTMYQWRLSQLNPDAPDYQDLRDAADKARERFVEDLVAGDPVFENLKHAERVKSWISRMDIAVEFVPAATALAGLIAEQVRDHRAALRELRERQRVKLVVGAFAAEILGDSDDPAEGSWRHAVSSVRARLHADALLEPVTVAARERMEIIESACQDLR
jgi:hypothetical protein